MNEIVFAITVGFLLTINIVIAFIRKKGERFTLLTYAADPNKNNFIVIALTLTGTIVGGGMFLAIGQMGYEAKYIGILLGVVYLFGLFIFGIYTKKIRNQMKKQNVFTIIDFMSANYDKKVVALFTVINFFMYLFLLASQFVAIFQFLSYIELKFIISSIPYILVCLAIISLFLYPIIGGIRKDIQTDIIHMITIFITSGLIIYQLIKHNAVTEVFFTNHFTNPPTNNYGVVFIIGAILFLTPSFFVRMDMWQRINTAKTDRDARIGFWIAGILSFFFFVMFTLIGSYANVIKSESGQFASLNTIYSLYNNPIAIGFIIGGFFAAVLSTADTMINNVSIFAIKLVTPKLNFSSHGNDNNRFLNYTRFSAVLLTIISIIISFIVPNIVDLIIGAFSLLLIFFPTILGLLRKHNNSNAAFYSALASFILFLILFFFWNPKIAFVPPVFISFLIYFLFYFFDRNRIKRDNF